MSSKPTATAAELRLKTDEELAEHMSGWRPGTGDALLADMEVKRRQNASNNVRGWIAIVISSLALVVSFIALLLK